jgi:hypothetical protein
MKAFRFPRFIPVWTATALVFAANADVSAQNPLFPRDGAMAKPLVDFESLPPPPREQPTSGGTARLRLFGMPTGFLRDPIGVDSDDPVPLFDWTGAKTSTDDDSAGLLVTMGTYNPFFDMLRPDDPRGLGYYKFHSQMQVLDVGRTSVSLTLQALTPAGVESGGLANGPTILTPAFAWFHDLGAGNALQGYVGQNIHANSQWTDNLGTRIHYGLGVQCPVPGFCPQPDQGLFFFIQAMGRYRCDNRPDGRASVWEVIPGLHWRLNENCWFSVGASRLSLFTWAWQF